MNRITVTIYGDNIRRSIQDRNYTITIPVTYSPSGSVLNEIDLSQFIEYLETDYIDQLDKAEEYYRVQYYSDTLIEDGQAETELYFSCEYPYIYSV